MFHLAVCVIIQSGLGPSACDVSCIGNFTSSILCITTIIFNSYLLMWRLNCLVVVVVAEAVAVVVKMMINFSGFAPLYY
jgi:hypothetical protein